MNDQADDLSSAEGKITQAEEAAKRVEQASATPQSHSLFSRTPAPPPREQWEFNRALLGALREVVRGIRETSAQQRARIEHVEQQSAAVLSMGERIHELQRRAQEMETRLDRELQENVTPAVQGMRDEMRERMQALLDEQRVCLRQLSLQTSEEAVLADRARRGMELRLDELAQRLEQLGRASAA